MPVSALFGESLARMASQLEDARCNHKTTTGELIRLEVAFPAMDLVSWLQSQAEATRCFWADRDNNFQMAGLGVAETHTAASMEEASVLMDVLSRRLQPVKAETPARYYGGVAFNKNSNRLWSGFGYTRFILPRLELVQSGDKYRLICNLHNSRDEFEQAFEALDQLVFPEVLPEFNPTEKIREVLEPSHGQWLQQVDHVLTAIATGQVDKAVLSRRSSFSFMSPVPAWSMLARWGATQIASYQFGFQFDNSPCYIGCSPERLFCRDGRQVTTEALAGTMACTTDPEQNDRLARRLLGDRKNLHENALVLQDIRHRLQPLCQDLIDDGDHTVLRLRNLQHLRFAFKGVLKLEITDGELLQTLHPTPAVGGYPRQPASELISTLETHTRGWYSGACGYIGADKSEFSVAIRSGLVEGNTVHLFSGAGLVAGSDAELEWEELNAKIHTPGEVLGMARQGADNRFMERSTG
ncbi:isochorismate synthase [Spongorhabdus nitratireducens]